MLKLSVMSSVTKRLVLAESTAAKPHDFATAQVVGISLAIYNGKISFDLK
jgi:hypothetical protein